MLTLRSYQTDLINKTRESYRKGHRSTLLVAPCGAGKTVLFSCLSHLASNKGKRILILAHRSELIEQISETLKQFEVKHSFISPDYYFDYKSLVHVASVFSVVRRLKYIPTPDIIIIDEAHHGCKGSTWARVLEYFPNAWRIGVTASPIRLSGEPLGDVFKDLIIGPSTRDLIDADVLSDYKIYCPSNVDVTKFHTVGGDFKKDEINKAMDKPVIVGSAIREYVKYAFGKRAIVFCCSIEHAKKVASEFNGAGFTAAYIEGAMDKNTRKKIVDDFRSGKLQIMTSVNIVSEGFDLPAIEVAIMLRPTKSLSLWIQMSGRSLRKFPGKPYAIILDHASNTQRLGMPCEDREWSLGGKQKIKEKAAISIRVCPSCFFANHAYMKSCGGCGYVFAVQPREVEHKEGELIEINSDIVRADRSNELWQAQTREQLYALAVKRKYRNPNGWVHMILQARQAKKLQSKQPQGATA